MTTDHLPAETSVKVPIGPYRGVEDAHVELTLASGELGHDALIEAFKVLRNSKAPVSISMEGPRPMPFLVSIEEAARVLCVTPAYVEGLIKSEWLGTVFHRPNTTSANRATSLEVAESTGDYTGWEPLVIWKDVEKVAEWACREGHLPSPKNSAPRRGVHKITPAGNQSKTRHVSKIICEILLAAKDENGEHAWMKVQDLHGKVEEWLKKPVPFNTVQSSVGTHKYSLRSRGIVEHRLVHFSDVETRRFMERAEVRYLGKPPIQPPREPGHVHKLTVTSRPYKSTTGVCTCGWHETVEFPRYKGWDMIQAKHLEHRTEERRKWEAEQATKEAGAE